MFSYKMGKFYKKNFEKKGGGGTSADSFPKVSKILYMEQMVLPGEIEGYFFFVGQLKPNPMCIFHKKTIFSYLVSMVNVDNEV